MAPLTTVFGTFYSVIMTQGQSDPETDVIANCGLGVCDTKTGQSKNSKGNLLLNLKMWPFSLQDRLVMGKI